jgi:hypothetical protein
METFHGSEKDILDYIKNRGISSYNDTDFRINSGLPDDNEGLRVLRNIILSILTDYP